MIPYYQYYFAVSIITYENVQLASVIILVDEVVNLNLLGRTCASKQLQADFIDQIL